jgi:hypothetical protein
MIDNPIDVLKFFPIRKSTKQKRAFLDAAKAYGAKLGYEVKEEKGSMKSVNLIFGDADQAKYLVTAHYDTCAGSPLPNLITPFNFWIYLGYQIALVLIILAAAFLVGIPVAMLSGSDLIGYYAGLLVYFALLFLMMMGPANKNNANDNTSGVVTALQVLNDLPEESRKNVCVILFDMEEAGLVGSSSYRKAHKEASNSQVVLNLDCVGDGDELFFIPSRKVIKNAEMIGWLQKAERAQEEKLVKVHQKGFAIYPSDQKNFPYGVGICALKKGKIGHYMDKIHTSKDLTLDEKNVSILTDCIIDLVK